MEMLIYFLGGVGVGFFWHARLVKSQLQLLERYKQASNHVSGQGFYRSPCPQGNIVIELKRQDNGSYGIHND